MMRGQSPASDEERASKSSRPFLMKILLVNDYATPTGGAELVTLGLREALRKEGHDARVFSSSAGSSREASFADYECVGTISRWRTLLQVANPWAFKKLRRVLAEFQPDVVHVRMFLTQLSPLILPLLRDIPSLYHVVWYRPICPIGTKTLPDGAACQTPAGAVCYRNRCLPLRDWFLLMLQMWLWRRWRHVFNLVVANSEATRRHLVAEGIEPVEMVWNGVPNQLPRPPLSAPPTVVFAGRLVLEKGVDVLLQAFAKVVARIPEARLLVIGSGPERDTLDRLIADLGLVPNVSMLGHLSRLEMERHCGRAWVQVVPSRWAEPFGLVAAEAMMRGTAVIASASGGLVEIVRHRATGILVAPGDADTLAQALLQLLKDRELAEQMGKAGRQVALECFNEKLVVDRFIQFYESICQKSKEKHSYQRNIQGRHHGP
jgi:glycosyltransferase involved in cell wall biosynthesis